MLIYHFRTEDPEPRLNPIDHKIFTEIIKHFEVLVNSMFSPGAFASLVKLGKLD